MRHHDFIQKKVISYVYDFYQNYLTNEDNEEWLNFFEEIKNFDNYDNYIDQMRTDDKKIVILQYYYSHVDNNGNINTMDIVKENNVWINDNLDYYHEVEGLMEMYKNGRKS